MFSVYPLYLMVPLRIVVASGIPYKWAYAVLSLLGKPSKWKPGKKSKCLVHDINSPPGLISTTCPLLIYRADEIVFRRAPLGDQENLYRKGLSLNSGAGRPENQKLL